MRLSRNAVGAVFAASLVATSLVLAETPALASFHLTKIEELFPGSVDAPNAQFIELQMYASGQNFVTGKSVVVTNAAGAPVGTFTFPGNVSNGQDQATILLATPEAETLFGVSADLAMTPVIAAAGGSACWAGTIDCVAWGSYSGPTTNTGPPFSPAGLVLGQSMERKTGGGTDPNQLDAGDDTNDSSADFQLATPSPMPNAVPAPPRKRHKRTITLSFAPHMVAKGKVSAAGGFKPCVKRVPVKVQRRKSGAWLTMKRTKTDAAGSYSVMLAKHRGLYRSVAPVTKPGSTDKCAKAVSPAVHHN
jgi:predicted aconitase with swiveling domain